MARKKQPAEKKPTKPQPMDVREPVPAEESPVPAEEPTPTEPEAVNAEPGTQDPAPEIQDPVEPVDKPTEATTPQDPSEPTEPSPIPAEPVLQMLRDPRLPPVGATITRQYKGQTLEVIVTQDGFMYQGEVYSSLSKLASRICHAKACNGFAFFKLGTVAGGKGRSGAGATSRLAGKIHRIEGLVIRLKTAVQDGQTALAEAEADLMALREKAEQLAPKSE